MRTGRGYDGVGVREIARAAKVDPRLIGRYFGSKEGLFAEVVDLAYEKSLMMTPELNAQAARELLTGTDKSAEAGMLLTLRSAANPRAAAIMRDSIERNYQRRLADALPGTDTTNASEFIIVDDRAAYAEHMISGFTYTDDMSVSALTVRFDRLRGECLRASESLTLIREMRETWTAGVSPLIRAATAGPA